MTVKQILSSERSLIVLIIKITNGNLVILGLRKGKKINSIQLIFIAIYLLITTKVISRQLKTIIHIIVLS